MTKRVGVIGGGQLAWMMAGAAKKLGVELVVQTPSRDDPAVGIAADTILAAIDDATATAQLAAQCDVITFENEFVNLEALSLLANQGVCFRPSLDSLKPLLDKYHQRCYLQELGLPTPRFAVWEGGQEAAGAEGANEGSQKSEVRLRRELRRERSAEQRSAEQRSAERSQEQLGTFRSGSKLHTSHLTPHTSHLTLSFPIVLKTRRHGYDGQGTFVIEDVQALEQTLKAVGDRPLLIEEFVPFERELAAIAARSLTGEIVVYPIVETQQEQQVCRRVVAPANISAAIVEQVNAITHTLLNSLQFVGVCGIEFFLTTDGTVLVNEIAPRTHNSGHFTLDACDTSQFEQQLRAVCGLPLGNVALRSPGAVMVNLLGYEQSHSDYQEKQQQLAAIPQAHVHWYGKTESRPGRKLGHVTVLLGDVRSANEAARTVESIWYR